jgi:capsular polysaccharide biosynthesis protein
LVNEDEIINVLDEFGFKWVTLESMSVIQQVALFTQAEVVIAPHGSGLTNILFCQPGTKVIELFAPNYVYPCYWYLSNLVGLDYYYVLGEAPEGFYWHQLLYPNSRVEDMWINPNALVALLNFADVFSIFR